MSEAQWRSNNPTFPINKTANVCKNVLHVHTHLVQLALSTIPTERMKLLFCIAKNIQFIFKPRLNTAGIVAINQIRESYSNKTSLRKTRKEIMNIICIRGGD